jgi:hypothetical protein
MTLLIADKLLVSNRKSLIERFELSVGSRGYCRHPHAL